MRKPRYVNLSTTAIELLQLGTDTDRLEFFRFVMDTYDALTTGKTISVPETRSLVLRRAIENALPELQAGFTGYMAKVNANPSGKSKGNPMGNPEGDPKDRQTEEKKEKKDDSFSAENQYNNALERLSREGYTGWELIEAIRSVIGKSDITDYYRYMKTVLDRKRGEQEEG